MNPRHLAPAAAAAVLLALVGLVVLAGGGAVATGLSAGHTPPSSCPRRHPTPTPTASGTAGPSPSATPTPSGPGGPRAVFAAAYLTRLAAPASPANLAFLTAWMTAESGPDTGSPTLSAARYNPLNTTMTRTRQLAVQQRRRAELPHPPASGSPPAPTPPSPRPMPGCSPRSARARTP